MYYIRAIHSDLTSKLLRFVSEHIPLKRRVQASSQMASASNCGQRKQKLAQDKPFQGFITISRRTMW